MRYCKGFSLIELIVVIVLVGILAAGAGLLITRPIEAYSDQIRRSQLVDSAEMALRRIAVDVRRALPNSIRVVNNSPNGWALEMVNTVDGARYRDEFGGAFITPDDILQFTVLKDQIFNLLGGLTTMSIGSYPDYRVVIYNTNPVQVYNDAANNNDPGIISAAGLALSQVGIEQRITLNASHEFQFQSPTQRLFVVDGPISYICDDSTGRLTRFEGYTYRANQAAVDTVGELSALANVQIGRVASQVSSCSIVYQAGTSQRGGLITLELAVTDSENESVQLLHQIHVENAP